MIRILVVTDVPWVRNDVSAALNAPDYELVELDVPEMAAGMMTSGDMDVALIDLQVAAMGGMAITRSIRDRAELAGRAQPPVVMLLDRGADAFLAGRAGASSWLTKPFTAHELRTAIATAVSGGALAHAATASAPADSEGEVATIE